jgi:transcriptional regulator with XRE-family HTH domain
MTYPDDDTHPLRRWRKENDVTLAALASEVGVTPSHLSEIERGLNGVSLALSKRLSKATKGGVSLDEIAEATE